MSALNFGQFIQHLADKAAIKADDQNLINILSNAELTKVQVPEALFAQIDNKLLSIDDAKNNHPLVKAHYFAQAYNGLDSELARLKDEMGVSDDDWKDIGEERSSTKKAVMLVKKIKDIESKKSTGNSASDKALQKKIDELVTELTEEKRKVQETQDNAKKEINGFKVQTQRSVLLSALGTIYDDLDPEVKQTTLNALLDKAARENDVDFQLSEQGSLDIKKKDGSNFYTATHQLMSPKDFIESTLANAKVLKTTQAQTPPPAGGTFAPTPGIPANVQGGQNPKANSVLSQLVADAKNNLSQAPAVQIGL